MNWPDNRAFAFTIFDDTDLATVENTRPVYDFCRDLGFQFTKSVWPLRGDGVPKVGGATCEDTDYLDWTLSLKDQGFEIGYHCATYHTAERPETIRGIERFNELYGHYPLTMSNHTGCLESIYWGNARLTGINRLMYDLLTRFGRSNKFKGHVEGHRLFWGDVCRDPDQVRAEFRLFRHKYSQYVPDHALP